MSTSARVVNLYDQISSTPEEEISLLDLLARADQSSQENNVLCIAVTEDRRLYELCCWNLLSSGSKRLSSGVTITPTHYAIDRSPIISFYSSQSRLSSFLENFGRHPSKIVTVPLSKQDRNSFSPSSVYSRVILIRVRYLIISCARCQQASAQLDKKSSPRDTAMRAAYEMYRSVRSAIVR